MAARRRHVASSSRNARVESVVTDCGRRRSTCGYCRSSSRTSISHGLWARSLTVDDYQDLLDRGWRRSGCFLYKPEMESTCCPSYTIRLKASDFVPSKEQLRVSRRMQRFLDGTLETKKIVVLEDANASRNSEGSVHHKCPSPASEKSITARSNDQDEDEKILHYLSDQINNVVLVFTEKEEFPSGIQLPKASVKKVPQVKRKLLVNGSEDLLYSCNIAFQIAACIKRVQSDDKDDHQPKPSRNCSETNGSSPKTIAEKLATSLDPVSKISGLSIRACNGHINFYSPGKQVSLSECVQNAAVPKKPASKHGSGGNCSSSREHCQLKRLRLEIHLKKSSFDPEEFALFRRYQLAVHNDGPENVSENSYRRFLVDTPLFHVPPTGDGTVPPCGFGSFHQQYVIDGKLVAVGVIDILPRCLSSKYLFWDPDFAFLSLGKYSALQEINWVKENQAYCPSLQYYYLGYYIHSCNKMRYKAAYRPSELLCPLRYQWVPFDIAKPLLDKKPYAVLSDSSILESGESSSLQVTEDAMERQHDDIGLEDANDIPMDDGQEMTDVESESSDDESGPESTSDGETIDVSNILLGLADSRLRCRDLRTIFGSNEQIYYLEAQLRRYMRVVGSELSERIVYSLE